MRAFLDTSILIADATANEPAPDLTDITSQVSSVVISELQFGVALAVNPRARAQRELRLQRILALYRGGIPYDDDAAASFGYLTNLVIAAGQNPRVACVDRMIAAAAHSRNVALVTRDNRFQVFQNEIHVEIR